MWVRLRQGERGGTRQNSTALTFSNTHSYRVRSAADVNGALEAMVLH